MVRRVLFAIGVAGLVSSCGGEVDEAMTDEASAPTATEPSGETINLDDYGFIGEQRVGLIAAPDWLPEDLALPDDTVAVYARSLTSGRQIFYGITKEPAEGLFDILTERLRSKGYEVRDGEYYRSDNLVYFGGNG
jgi:hypothetical protein